MSTGLAAIRRHWSGSAAIVFSASRGLSMNAHKASDGRRAGARGPSALAEHILVDDSVAAIGASQRNDRVDVDANGVTSTAFNGYTALDQYDEDQKWGNRRDGRDLFAAVFVRTDALRDGVSQPMELHSMAYTEYLLFPRVKPAVEPVFPARRRCSSGFRRVM